MPRIILLELLLLATPFALFIFYRMFVASRRRALGREINETPYQFLLFLGAAAAIGLLGYLAWTNEDATHRNEFYVPAHFVEGERVPARWITREQAIEEGLIPPEPDVSRDVVRDRERARDDEPEDR